MSSDPATQRGEQLRRAFLRCVATVTVFFGLFFVLPFRGERWWVGALVGTALLALMLPLAVRRLRRVLTSERPLFEAFESVVQLVTMLIVGFASVYYAMDRDVLEIQGLDTRVDSLYVTVTTLSTVGFGDITPVTQEARLVVTAQMMIDIVFLGVVFRVFAKAARQSPSAREQDFGADPGTGRD